VRRMIGIFLVLVGMRGNFEGIDGYSLGGRGGGRRLCKEDVEEEMAEAAGKKLCFASTP